MDPQTFLFLAAALACPIGMGLMMWMMNRNMGGQHGHSMPGSTTHTSDSDRLAALREQRQLLEQEIAEVEKIAALEAKKKALGQSTSAESPNASDTQPARSIN